VTRPSIRRTAGMCILAAVVVLGGCTDDAAPRAGASKRATTTVTTTTTTTATTTSTVPAVAPTTVPPSNGVEVPDGGDLYADPPTPTGAAPGELVRYQRVVETPGPTGVVTPGALWRVMYTSTDDAGAPIVVTGLIRVPTDRPAPTDGWPVIAWAHGTSGTADRCAPSKQLDYPPVPDPMVADGFVIASTDYAGLGTPGLHPYFDGASEGRAVLDIVTAAGHLPGVATSRKFALWGHSQGGHAVLFARQLAAERLPDHELVGTVALAPPSLVKDSMTAILVALQPKGFAAMTVAGIAAAHPDARLSDILTPAAVAAIEGVVDSGCSSDVDRVLSLFGKQNIVVARPNEVEPWATYLAQDEPAMAPGTGPLLIVHSIDDRTVPQSMSSAVKERTCARGEPTLRWVTTSGGHNGIIDATRPQDRQWTLDRFAGVAPPSNCGQPDGPPPA